MKYSKTFAKSIKNIKEKESLNATLLQKAGFINQTMAGVFSFLPLGNRVLRKIEDVAREEMDKIGEEVFLPSIAPTELWKKTGRYELIDVLFKVVAANEKGHLINPTEYALNCSHEEIATPLAQTFINSYKDFPFALYQIQTKFRNEPRPKSGLMRCREFRMKDLYSFHTSEEDQMKFYNNEATLAYKNVFKKLGLGGSTVEVFASGGFFTKQFSKEFQTKCETGEDLIFKEPHSGVCYNQEIAPSKAPDILQDSEKQPMKVIETPNVIGMEDLPKFLGVTEDKCMKTLIYEADNGEVIVVAVRGTYDVNELKLATLVDVKTVNLASEEIVKKVTGAEIGYAGIVNLPENVKLFIDESMENAVNFECGANKTDHHNLNVNWDVDVKKPDEFYDIKIAKEGDLNPDTKEAYETFKASEVGNIFPLGTKYSEAFDYKFIDKDGKEKPVYMGSYGIGTSRVMGVIAEKYNDEKGLKWPISVAPFQVYLIDIGKEYAIKEKAKDLYNELINAGYEVLWDDRDDVSAGVKFTDCDLIGIPIRVLISGRSLEQNSVEVKLRTSDETVLVRLDDLPGYLKGKIEFLENEVLNS